MTVNRVYHHILLQILTQMISRTTGLAWVSGDTAPFSVNGRKIREKMGPRAEAESDEWTPADPREHLFFRIENRKQGLYTSILVRFLWFLSSTRPEFWAESNGTTPVRHSSKPKEILAQFGQHTRCDQYNLGFKVQKLELYKSSELEKCMRP